MAVRIVRLGSPRARGEGLRIGTVSRPPRGVRKEDISRRDFFDAWLPELAPSALLLAFAHAGPLDGKRWAAFSRKYRREMKEATPARLLALLAALSNQTDFSVGCYCEDEWRCHRSLLRELLEAHGARLA
jgi:uncharacterized protein YeaO (DUF488 family)